MAEPASQWTSLQFAKFVGKTFLFTKFDKQKLKSKRNVDLLNSLSLKNAEKIQLKILIYSFVQPVNSI